MKCWTKHLHRTRCDGVDIKQWYSLFSVSPIIVQAKKKISMLRPGVFDHKWPWINMSASNIIWVKWIKTPFFCTITPLYVCNQHFHISKSLNTLRAASFTSVWDWLIEFSVSRVLNVILTKNSDISNIQGQKSKRCIRQLQCPPLCTAVSISNHFTEHEAPLIMVHPLQLIFHRRDATVSPLRLFHTSSVTPSLSLSPSLQLSLSHA